MPFAHLQGRRKRDRFEVDLDAIRNCEGKLENLTPETQAYVDQAMACTLDLLDFNGADTFDRHDLFSLAMGAILLKQVWDRVPPSQYQRAYCVVMETIRRRVELLEAVRDEGV